MRQAHRWIFAAALGASAAIGTATAGAGTAGSDVFYSGPLNIVIPDNSAGVRLNWQTGALCYMEDTCNEWAYTFAVTAWWRWNGTDFVTNPVFYVQHPDLGLAYTGGETSVLQPGDTVHSGLAWGGGTALVGGGVWDGTPSALWWSGQDAYLGFRFRNSETHELNYGYAHIITTPPQGHPATIVDYAYDTTGAGITIPIDGVLNAPAVRLSFEPDTVPIGAPSTLTIALRNATPDAAVLSADFVDALPDGLVASAAETSCAGAGASIGAGGTSVTLAANAEIPADGSCTITATVVADAAATLSNTVPAGSLHTQLGDYPADASATLRTFDGSSPFPLDEDFDGTVAPALPDTGWFSIYWLGNSIGDPGLPPSAWVTTTEKADSGTTSAYVTDATLLGGGGYATDISLLSPVFAAGRDGSVSFRQNFDFFETDSRWLDDGGVLEISLDGGPFADLLESGGNFVDGGYIDRITDIYDNPLGGRLAWGNYTLDTWYTVTAALPPDAEGHDVQLRWRFGTDHVNKSQWWIDTVHVDAGSTANTHPPRIAAEFSPASVAPGASSRLTLTLRNEQALPAVITQDVLDELPEGLVATNPATTCACAAASCEISVGDGGELRLAYNDTSAYTIDAMSSCTVSADVVASAPGSYIDRVPAESLVVNFEQSNRRPASARLIATLPGDCLFADGFDGATACEAIGVPGTYEDAASFIAQVAPGYHEEFFDEVPLGQFLTWTSADAGGHGFTLSSAGYRDIGLWGRAPNFVSAATSWSAVNVVFDEPVTAIGGNFWAVDVDGNPTGTDIVVNLSDGSSTTFASSGPDDFLGFVTDTPITGISIDGPSPTPDGDVLFAMVGNLIVGSRR